MFQFAVCDDESFMRQDIVNRLARFMKERHLSCQICQFESCRSLLVCKTAFDMLFLDIQMEEPDGIEAARQWRKQGRGGLLIFITVLKECVFDAFEVQAFDYFVKPMDETRFQSTMARALDTLKRKPSEKLLIQRENACEVVPFSEVVYCEVLGRKIYLHQQDGQVIEYYERMDNLEKNVDGRFFRCHRSYLVNLDYVRHCREGVVGLADGHVIPVSRLRKRELMQALLTHMQKRERY